MFEARIIQGHILKKIIEAMRELVTDANLECHAEQGISMQVSRGLYGCFKYFFHPFILDIIKILPHYH